MNTLETIIRKLFSCLFQDNERSEWESSRDPSFYDEKPRTVPKRHFTPSNGMPSSRRTYNGLTSADCDFNLPGQNYSLPGHFSAASRVRNPSFHIRTPHVANAFSESGTSGTSHYVTASEGYGSSRANGNSSISGMRAWGIPLVSSEYSHRSQSSSRLL